MRRGSQPDCLMPVKPPLTGMRQSGGGWAAGRLGVWGFFLRGLTLTWPTASVPEGKVPSMPPIPAGYAIGSLRWTCVGDPEPHVSTIGLDVVSASTPTPAQVADLLSTAWISAHPAGALSALYVFIGSTVTFGPQPGEGPSAEDVRNVPGTASNSTAPPPTSNVSLLVKKSTALGGRRNRGRMYLPAGYLKETDIDQNGWMIESTRGVYQARMDAFLSNLTTPAPTLNPVILHSDALVEPTPITSFTVQRQVATQRRRMR